jgi:hypothetical protein
VDPLFQSLTIDKPLRSRPVFLLRPAEISKTEQPKETDRRACIRDEMKHSWPGNNDPDITGKLI